jgi:arylformamidase
MIYDITPPITPSLKVWPEDTVPSRQIMCDMRDGSSTTTSTLRTTVHAGAHADAPNHFEVGALSIGERPIEYYLGPCQVIGISAERGACLEPEAIGVPIEAPRVLLKTGTYPDPTCFNEDFAALSSVLIDWLAEQGVRLIGVDTPSLDPFASKDLPAHHATLRYDMAILEGLVLDAVPDGCYELIALPLKLIGFDGSPVRAVLRTVP